MTPYEQGFLSKCAEHGVPEDTAFSLMKLAVDIGSFDPMAEGVGISTRSRYEDFNNFFASGTKNPPYESMRGVNFPDKPSITRIRHGDGHLTYRVTRRLATPYSDRAGRPITRNFSVEVDSPLKAMRLAKGKVRFDKNTAGILDHIASSSNGHIADAVERARMKGLTDAKAFPRENIGRFGLMTSDPGVDRGVKEVIRGVEKHPIKLGKLLRRLAKLHPRAAKAIAIPLAIGVPTTAGGAVVLSRRHKK